MLLMGVAYLPGTHHVQGVISGVNQGVTKYEH